MRDWELVELAVSAAGWAVVTFIGAGIATLASLVVTSRYGALKAWVLRRRSTGRRLDEHAVRAVIDPDLPDDAILALRDPLPPAPSGELCFDRAENRWRDSSEVNGTGCSLSSKPGVEPSSRRLSAVLSWLRRFWQWLSAFSVLYFGLTVGLSAMVSGGLLVVHADPGWFLVGIGAVIVAVVLVAVVWGPWLATRGLGAGAARRAPVTSKVDPAAAWLATITGETLVKDAESHAVALLSVWAQLDDLRLAEVALLRRLAITPDRRARVEQCSAVLLAAGVAEPLLSMARLETRQLIGVTTGSAYLSLSADHVVDSFTEVMRSDPQLAAGYRKVTLGINKSIRFDGELLVEEAVRPWPS